VDVEDSNDEEIRKQHRAGSLFGEWESGSVHV
jgi:hypothetical protein